MPDSTAHSIIVPTVTPLDSQGRFDPAGMENLLTHLIQANVHGVFIGGTTGESVALPLETRIRLIKFTTSFVQGRIVVVAGSVSACFEESRELQTAAELAGCDFLAIQPPPYFPMTETEIECYCLSLIANTGLPVILYDIPAFSHKNLSPVLVSRLYAHPQVVGVKDSTGSLSNLSALVALGESESRPILVGDECQILDALRLGAAGAVPSIANLHPELCVGCYQSYMAGDIAAAMSFQQRIRAIVEPVRRENSWIKHIEYLKLQLAKRGICQSFLSASLASAAHPSVLLNNTAPGSVQSAVPIAGRTSACARAELR